jgi:hypothetical protein
MSDTDYVEPLSGEEIIIDLCSLIAEKLRKDCNLRDADSYSGGYSATVSVHLEAYGLDTATVDTAVTNGRPPQADPDELIDTTLEIPVEPALDQVRERSDQPVPTLAEIDGEPVIQRRRYVRRTGGGATGESL